VDISHGFTEDTGLKLLVRGDGLSIVCNWNRAINSIEDTHGLSLPSTFLANWDASMNTL
jgi:hypothetical protein